MFVFQQLSLVFLLGSITLAAPTEKCADEVEKPAEVEKPTVYAAWTTPTKPPQEGAPQLQGIGLPLRQNGTWIDVGVWEFREDIIHGTPFLFTLGPGSNENTRTIVQVDSGKKLAHVKEDLDVPVNYGALAAFILTDEGSSDKWCVDEWTVGKDSYGRTLLGTSGEGTDWTMSGCAWTNGKQCDGYYFLNCEGCYGTPTVIEVKEWKG